MALLFLDGIPDVCKNIVEVMAHAKELEREG
jgi:hypothetical protein